ncbi:E3 ubiquitin-protein ligase mib2 [Bulinus truncatus]|nr:E3 ubiquitin-protein ligase mib2 [Bulinus truncatus]
MKAGLRVVRGPDWNRGNEDGGEGHLGTVIKIDQDKRIAIVQWDHGKIKTYRAGKIGEFDLHIYDNSQICVKHECVLCDECKENGIKGLRWKCSVCSNYDLCSSCYNKDKHSLSHSFLRFDTDSDKSFKVIPRQDSQKCQAWGIFQNATVIKRFYMKGDVATKPTAQNMPLTTHKNYPIAGHDAWVFSAFFDTSDTPFIRVFGICRICPWLIQYSCYMSGEHTAYMTEGGGLCWRCITTARYWPSMTASIEIRGVSKYVVIQDTDEFIIPNGIKTTGKELIAKVDEEYEAKNNEQAIIRDEDEQLFERYSLTVFTHLRRLNYTFEENRQKSIVRPELALFPDVHNTMTHRTPAFGVLVDLKWALVHHQRLWAVPANTTVETTSLRFKYKVLPLVAESFRHLSRLGLQ